MDFLFGIKGKDFVMVCSDTCASQQIITIKHDEDKLVPIDSHKLICISGARCLSLKRQAAGAIDSPPAFFSYARMSIPLSSHGSALGALRCIGRLQQAPSDK